MIFFPRIMCFQFSFPFCSRRRPPGPVVPRWFGPFSEDRGLPKFDRSSYARPTMLLMCNVDKHEKCLRTICIPFSHSRSRSRSCSFSMYYVYRLIPTPTVPSAHNIMRSVESVSVFPVAPSLGWLVGAVVEVVTDQFRGITFNLKY